MTQMTFPSASLAVFQVNKTHVFSYLCPDSMNHAMHEISMKILCIYFWTREWHAKTLFSKLRAEGDSEMLLQTQTSVIMT